MKPTRAFLVPSGYNFRAVLAFCRALRQIGLRPAIVACTASDPIFATQFAGDVVFTRSSRVLDLADFANAIQATVARCGVTRCVLAPTSEFLVRWAFRQRRQLAALGCDLPLPDEEVYMTVTDKAAFTGFARRHGLPVPAEVADISAARLPTVAKPRWNVSPEGRSLYPWLCRTPADLERFAAEEKPANFFFQEWIEGRSFYLFFHLPKQGREVVYSQENIAQQPGGKSILLARAARLHETAEAGRWAGALRAAGFHGLAMIELRQRGSEHVLIEANPRLWGPLQLCIDGCPALVMNYIAEHCGIVPPTAALRAASPAPDYLWLGGVMPGMCPDWHGCSPRFPHLHLLAHLMADVYLRGDSWRYFLHERRAARQAIAARELRSATVPAPS